MCRCTPTYYRVCENVNLNLSWAWFKFILPACRPVYIFFVNICDTTTDCVYVMWQLLKNVAYTSCVHTYKIVDSRKQEQEQEEYGTLAWQMWFLILQFLTFAFAFILDFTRPNLKHAHNAPPPTWLLHFTPHSSLSLYDSAGRIAGSMETDKPNGSPTGCDSLQAWQMGFGSNISVNLCVRDERVCECVWVCAHTYVPHSFICQPRSKDIGCLAAAGGCRDARSCPGQVI